MLKTLAFACIFWGVSYIAVAEVSPVQQWINKAHQLQLADSLQWMSLVHYRPNTIRSGYTSFASGREFFLAENGRVDPQAELDATLNAIALPVTSDPDKHAQCRFVARFHWLKQVLAIPDDQLPAVKCTAFEQWYHNINPARVTLVFPSAYIDNPSFRRKLNPAQH